METVLSGWPSAGTSRSLVENCYYLVILLHILPLLNFYESLTGLE